jgi:hypothetical protein
MFPDDDFLCLLMSVLFMPYGVFTALVADENNRQVK